MIHILYMVVFILMTFFFFQAEDGIRNLYVTGVQTCALPISAPRAPIWRARWRCRASPPGSPYWGSRRCRPRSHILCSLRSCKIGRASCRERVIVVYYLVPLLLKH